MKKIFMAGLLALMCTIGRQAPAQTVGCDDTVHWGTPLSFDSYKCCWTVLEGPTDCFYSGTNQIDCNYDTLADHRFLSPWVEIPSFAATDSLVLIYATQVSCTADYSVAITTDGVNYDTLRRRLVDSYEHDTILLGAYAGQVVRIEFCHYGLNSRFYPYAGDCSYAADYHWQLLFGALQWRSLVYPVATWWVPTKAYVGETTWLRASLSNGSHTGLTYTWHSSLTGQTLTGDSVELAYTAAGLDTLTLVVSNAFGSDTLTQTVTVVDCGDVITAHPWKVDFVNEYDCWRTVGTVGWSYAGRNISGKTYYGISAVHNSGGANIIASPAVVLPADSTGLRLYWKDSRLSSGTSTYYVLVSTTSRYDIAEYDTVFTCTSQTSNVTQRSVSLADYAGDTVYIAFCKMLQNGRTVFITDVQMYNALAPIGVMYAPNYARVGETTNYTVALSQGDTLGLTVTLHSALKDSSWTMNADALGNGSWGLDLVYDTPGEETVTVTASNAQGTLMLNASLSVFVCNTVSTFPWAEDFSNAAGSYNACWTINGYSHNSPNSNYGGYDEETGEMWSMTNCMKPSAAGNYMITPPIAIPANDTNMAFMVEYLKGAMDIRVSPTALTDTALFTDLLFTEPTSNYIKRRWINLGAYAGQTIRVALVTSNPNNQCVNRVLVDVDTLPYIGTKVSMPAKIHCDSTALCTVALFHGATDGLHYSWTSAVGGIITTNALGDSAWVNYGAGFSSTEDTITVIATNAYGADTVTKPLHIIDCTPALTLPWRETFDDGLACWYKPEGSNFGYWNNNCMHSYCNSDTIDSWIMSKAVTIPADTNKEVILEWKAASSNNTFVHTYYVLATTSANYTDTANYIPLYYDSSAHPTYSTFDKRSVSLRQFAGQTIHVAFRNRPVNATGSNYRLIIDDVAIRSAQLPVVSLSAPTTVNSHEDVTYTATYVEGSTNGLSLTWHSALLDSTWTGLLPSAANWALVYPVGGYDTITVIATNIYGADSATRVVMVNSCLIDNLPYEETFIGVTATTYNHSSGGKVPNCWHRYWAGSTNYMPHVINSYLRSTAINTYVQSNPALLLMAGSGDGFDSVATVESPIFDAPLNGQLLSFYYMHEGANHGQLSVGYLQNGAFVKVKTMERQVTGRTDTVSLSAFPADVHRFALRWVRSDVWYGVIVDNIRVFAPDTLPHVHLTVPQFITYVGDTTTYNAYLTDGMADGLTYTWHSTLLGTTVVAGSQWSVVYNISGYDTVTVIATNAYGSDTAWGVHYVDTYPLPQVTIVGPASMTLQGSIDSRTANFIPTLNNCSPNGLTYTWHSTLLNQWSTTSGQWSVVYNTGGIDTVTLIVSNVDGADTATKIVNVYDCRGLAAPYFEDFEGVTPTAWDAASCNLPGCWSSIAIGASHRPKVVSSYQYISNLPNQALLIMAGNYSGYADAAYVMLPIFSDSLQRLSVAFDYRCESASYGTLTVGYWNDSLLTFHPVRNLASHTGNYLRDTVSFDDVASVQHLSHTHIALKWYCNSSFYGVVIDNIEVFRDSSDFAPTGLAVDSVSAHCATLSWQPYTEATAYHVTIGTTVDTMVSGTTVTICGLDEATPYVAGVAPVVAGVIGYHATVAFTTLPYCSALAGITYAETGGNLVLTCQFDSTGETTPAAVNIAVTDLSTSAQWQTVGTGDGDTLTSFAAGHNYRIVVTALCGGVAMGESDTLEFTMPASVCYEVRGPHSESYRFIDAYSYYNYDQMLYPAAAVGSVDTLYGIAFRVTEQNSNRYRTVDIYVGHSMATTLTSPVSAANLTQVADDYTFSIADTGWSRIIFDSPFAYDGTSNLIVTLVDVSGFLAPFSPGTGMHAPQAGEAFLYKSFSSSSVPDPYTLNFTPYTFSWMPDIQLLGGCDYNQCLGPWVTVDSTTTHSISLSWEQRGTESLWQVEYRTESDAPWMVVTTTAATAYTMTGLTPSTTYQFRLASLCSGDIVYGDSLTACTACDTVQLPYHTDFTIEHYPCWNTSGYTWETFLGISLNPNMTQYNHYVVSPAVGTPLNDVTVTVRAMNPNNDSYYSTYDAFYEVGVCDADGSNPVWIDTVGFAQRHVVEEHTFYLHNYTGSARHIIIRPLINSFTLYSVTLDQINGCIPVHEVWVSHLTDTSATAQWEPENSANSHAVYFEGSLLGIAPAGTTAWPLPTLTPSTEYTVAVREICSAGDTSAAISHTFSTACEAVGLPYFEGFGNGSDLGYDQIHGMPDCWTLHDNPYGTSVYYNPELLLYSSGYADSSISNYIISPLLNVGYHGATVSFKAKAGFASIAGFVEIGVMTNVSDTGSFIPCVTVEFINGGAPLQWYQFNTATMALPDVWAVAIRWDRGHQGAFDSLTVTANPVVEYTLSLDVNDTAMGSVTGGGTYMDSSMVTITATANDGYSFTHWNDGDTNATRNILLVSDTAFTAIFAADTMPTPPSDTVWRTVTVHMLLFEGDTLSEGDDISVTGAGMYPDSSLVTLTAFHDYYDNYPYFWYWVTPSNDTLYDNPYSFVITSDTVINAIFGPMCVGITDVDDADVSVVVHPNPAHGDVTVSVGEASVVAVSDLQGRTVLQPTPVASTLRIAQGTLPKGIYFVSVGNSRGTTVKKLVIQ